MAKKRRKLVGDMADLKRVMWRTLCEVEDILDVRPLDCTLVLRAAHALSQVASTYAKILYDHEIEQRLSALERADAERNGQDDDRT